MKKKKPKTNKFAKLAQTKMQDFFNPNVLKNQCLETTSLNY